MANTQTLIAVFRNSADAQAAAQDLQNAGIRREAIDIQTGTGNATASNYTQTNKEGGIVGWFKSVFGEENDRDRTSYETAVKQGSTLLQVDVLPEQINSVEAILNRHSPVDIHDNSYAATGNAAVPAAGTTATAARGTEAIPVVEEELQVGKRQVLRGGVRVYSRVIEEPVEESVALREEHIRLERRPANRAATEADLTGGREQVIEVQEFAEEPVVSKQARVVEEVVVGKDVSERTETVRDTLRRTEVDVEETPGAAGKTIGATELPARTKAANR